MQKIADMIRDRVRALLADGTVQRVAAWQPGEFFYDHTPAILEGPDAADRIIYDGFCGSNLSKYLIAASNVAKPAVKPGTTPPPDKKVAALLKPCDTLSLNQLLSEHRVNRDNIYVIGVECTGMLDARKLDALGIKGATAIDENDDGETLTVHTIYGDKSCKREDLLLDKCVYCKGKQHAVADEIITTNVPVHEVSADRFEMVNKLDAMTAQERFEFWRGELSKCIRCNACRNVCPACSCLSCVFDNPKSDVSAKANADDFEENMFHIIRAFHVAGRCTDCGECSRVCPQGIPLHLLNRKFIKDINNLYGEFQAGADDSAINPLTSYTQGDAEPSIVKQGGDA